MCPVSHYLQNLSFEYIGNLLKASYCSRIWIYANGHFCHLVNIQNTHWVYTTANIRKSDWITFTFSYTWNNSAPYNTNSPYWMWKVYIFCGYGATANNQITINRKKFLKCLLWDPHAPGSIITLQDLHTYQYSNQIYQYTFGYQCMLSRTHHEVPYHFLTAHPTVVAWKIASTQKPSF